MDQDSQPSFTSEEWASGPSMDICLIHLRQDWRSPTNPPSMIVRFILLGYRSSANRYTADLCSKVVRTRSAYPNMLQYIDQHRLGPYPQQGRI